MVRHAVLSASCWAVRLRIQQIGQRSRARINDGRIVMLDTFDQSIKVADIRKLFTKEQIALGALDQNGRKIIHIMIVQKMWIVFDIDPDKSVLRPLLAQACEFRLIGRTRVAPGRAIAGNDQARVLFKLLAQCSCVLGIKYSHRDKIGRVCL